MSLFEMKLPDVGEGVAEAEIVDWLVDVGDEVTPDTVLAEVLTDKATVEVSSPVSGTIVEFHGEPGDVLAVGTVLVGIEVEGAVEADEPAPETEPEPAPVEEPTPEESEPAVEEATEPAAAAGPAQSSGAMAAPAVRRRARDLGVDIGSVSGSGPDGRVVHADLDALLAAGRPVVASAASGGSHVEPVRGVRRKISERLSAAWSEIPHITYVEAIDVTELEALRAELNRGSDGTRLTLLPFLVRAITIAVRDQPQLNAHHDATAETLTVHDAVHAGIATQTDSGLMVPVVRDAGNRSMRDLAAEIARVTEAARDGSAARDELTGSTITITSLGAIGGLATTPILNPPEVAIIGVNKMETRPVWRDGSFQPRKMFNLSSSFDHRMVDGWDAATFVQRIKTLLELPALLYDDD